MGEIFFCPRCGRDVRAPHFCDQKEDGAQVGIQLDLAPFFFKQPDARPWPEVPVEHTSAFEKLDADRAAGRATDEDYQGRKRHIEKTIALWRRINGKEPQDA